MYLREPYHLWQAIDPRMDVTGLHSDPEDTRFFMEADDVTDRAKKRFEKTIARTGTKGAHQCVIEKTPHNAGKLGWIEGIEPGYKVIHIVRNGLSVVRSMHRLATKPTYRLAHKPNYNQWWGENGAKWKALEQEGPALGYFSDEIDQLKSNTQRGAYEWLVSIGEVDRWRDRLGDRLLEVTYTQLTSNPAETCRRIAEHFQIPATDEWIQLATEMLSSERVNEGDELVLPPMMAKQFNEYQQRFGFDGRAVSSDLSDTNASN